MEEKKHCLEVWLHAEPEGRAAALDVRFPGCSCERHSCCAEFGRPIADGEILARIFTSPALYDLKTNNIVSAKLTAVYSRGLSIVRQGASDEEIEQTVRDLTEKQSEPQALVGAALFRASIVRRLADEDRWFCVYHTPAPAKTHHADVLGTIPIAESPTQQRKLRSSRRKVLADLLYAHIFPATSVAELIDLLRNGQHRLIGH